MGFFILQLAFLGNSSLTIFPMQSVSVASTLESDVRDKSEENESLKIIYIWNRYEDFYFTTTQCLTVPALIA